MKLTFEMTKEEVRILKELERVTGYDKNLIISNLLFEVYYSYKCAKKSKRIDDMLSCMLSDKLLNDIEERH